MLRVMGMMAGVLSALALAGCDSGPQPTPDRGNPTVTTSGNLTPTASTPRKPMASANAYKPVPLARPITVAKGKYTIRITNYWPQGDSSAAKIAEQLAEAYRKQGRDIYVTDLGNLAIVTEGSFDDPRDPRLTQTWRRVYADYLTMHGGKASLTQQQIDSFYEGSGAYGDQPWPLEIENLQMRMKITQGKITQEEYTRWQESVRHKKAGGTGGK